MPSILCAMRMPPNLDGHGGSQRAWRLLEALRRHGPVDFVLFYREQDGDCVDARLDAIEPLVRSVTRVSVAGWQPASRKPFGFVPCRVSDFLRMRTQEAPHLRAAELASIASRLPRRRYDVAFAGRLCTAFILQSLMDRGHLHADLRVVDFDDIMSKFRMRQASGTDSNIDWKRRPLAQLDALLIRSAERRIARSWHGVSVCTDEDVAALRAAHPGAVVGKVPNVVSRERLPARPPDGQLRVLFTGNLSAAPNIEGLRMFLEGGWSRLKRLVPAAQLVIVGLHPTRRAIDLAQRYGAELHTNVPSLRPFYADCDVVIAPILFGSGTRIKILEAMAYGRPVVSTSMGAEGMDLVAGRHFLLADDMDDFADAVASLAPGGALAQTLVEEAHAFQMQHYGPKALLAAVDELLERGRAVALGAERASPSRFAKAPWSVEGQGSPRGP